VPRFNPENVNDRPPVPAPVPVPVPVPVPATCSCASLSLCEQVFFGAVEAPAPPPAMDSVSPPSPPPAPPSPPPNPLVANVVSVFDQMDSDTLATCEGPLSELLIVAFKGFKPKLAACKQGAANLDSLKWSFTGCTWFAFTLMTTIGYGSFAPSTVWGRFFVCAYGVVGIAVTGVVLTTFANALHRVMESALRRFVRKDVTVRLRGIATILLGVFWVLLVGVIASFTYSWSFGEGIYFSITTLSTIGLGDFTMGNLGIASVIAQFTLFMPGLAIFANAIRVGSQAFEAVQERGVKTAVSAGSKAVAPALQRRSPRVLPVARAGTGSRTSFGAGPGE